MPGRLTVVGLGIRVPGQVTDETRRAIQSADDVVYLVADATSEAWLRRVRPRARSLADCYREGRPRELAYRQMVERILGPVREGRTVCAAFYGHPGVFVFPSHEAVRQARREGFEARMLPGISAEDCLFADLGIDPGRGGCQSFEATDFLVFRRRIDPRSSLILWQVGMVGRIDARRAGFPRNRPRLEILQRALVAWYPSDHEGVLYEASPFVVLEPSVRRIRLSDLARSAPDFATTLYVPPLPAAPDARVLRRLDIRSSEVQRATPCWEGDSGAASRIARSRGG